MPELYERLTGTHTDGRPKLPVHQLQALIAENQRGQWTAAQGIAYLELSATEQQEVVDLVGTIPGGSTTANQVQRALKLLEIDQVLLLAEHTVPSGIAPLNTTAAVRTRLGVPTR